MPRNASGVYSLPEPPVVTLTTIESADENNTRNDLAAELTNSLDRNGRGAMLAALGIVDGTIATPGLRFAADVNCGVYRIGNDLWALVSGGVDVARINGVTSAVNYLDFFPSIAGQPVSVRAGGSDANIDAEVLPKGTGRAKLGGIGTDRLVGRDTAGQGLSEDISLNATLEFTGAGAIQRAALTGDVTASAGSNAMTIANDAVTYAKMQNISASPRLLGRSTAGAGDPEEINVGGDLSQSGSNLNVVNNAITFAKMQDINTARVVGRTTAGTGDPEELSAGTNMSFAGGQVSTTAEINTASNVGAGSQAFKQKSGVNLEFRSFTMGHDAVLDSTGASIGAVNTIVLTQNANQLDFRYGVFVSGGGTSIHGDSLVEMADGNKEWISDIRLNDMVKGRNGPSKVLGIWRNELAGRNLWDVNGVICTPGHLFPIPNGWAAPAPEDYVSRTYGKPRAVKGINGMLEVTCNRCEPDKVKRLTVGDKILDSNNEWVDVKICKAYAPDGKDGVAYIPSTVHVYSLLLEGSDIFYVDGHAVATLA